MADEIPVPVEGVKDWFKEKIKGVLLSYAKPYWDDIKAAITGRDFGKLADIVDKIGAVAGYVELAKKISDLLRAFSAKDWADILRKAADLAEVVIALFKSSPTPQPANGGIMVSSDPVSLEISETVDRLFGDMPPVVGDSGDEQPPLGPDGKPQEAGFVLEAAAIISAIFAFLRWREERRKRKAG